MKNKELKMKLNIQFFARKKDNIKALNETRAEKVRELEELYEKLQEENRAVTEEEEEEIGAIQEEIDQIDKTIKILEEIKKKLADTNKGKEDVEVEEKKEGGMEETEQRARNEEKAFEDFLRGAAEGELRADANMQLTDNGAVIPDTIADKIIKKIYDICPILEKATKYNVKGNLTIPYYPADANDVKMAYAEEFKDLESTTGKFGNITLKGFLAGALTKVSRSLMNNSKFDIVSFVVDHIAAEAARWIEGELLNGTEDKIEGLAGTTQGITAAAATAVTADELIMLQDSVKDALQAGAIWIMSPTTRTAIRLLKDEQGRYLMQDDLNAPFGKTILGKPVYVSDNMPEMEAGKKAIYYGDMSGLAVKLGEEFEIQVLREHYATQHAVGVVGWLEMDAKVEDAQKISALTMKAQ